MTETKVLIAGAGPTGLVLALWLTRLHVPFRIVERNDGPGHASRAIAVQARTLEFHRQLGLADAAVACGIKMGAVHLREGSREVAGFRLGDLGKGLSPFPFVLSLPQDDHERLLVEWLRAAGVEVEWGTELVGFAVGGDRVRVRLRRDGADETCDVAYLCGCDGAHSAVREGLGVGFPGGTYEHVFYVADVRATGGAANGDLNLCLGARDFCAVLPVRSTGTQRLIGIVPDEVGRGRTTTFDDIRPSAERLVGVRVHEVNWFSTYQVHHRVADHFQKGRVFIAGDAGHVHSPAGGQGMNTGIGDAVNLAWKLAHVLQQRAAAALLDTYELERLPFARSLVATTDRAFQAMVSRTRGGQLFRTVLLPRLAPLALGFSAVRRAAFRLVSQIRVDYRTSPLSAGSAGRVHGGDRLPWAPGPQGDNFEPLVSVDWQVHVYGSATETVRDTVARHGIPLHEFSWTEATKAAGVARDAFYLVRPDGYVALAGSSQEISRLEPLLLRFGIGPRAQACPASAG